MELDARRGQVWWRRWCCCRSTTEEETEPLLAASTTVEVGVEATVDAERSLRAARLAYLRLAGLAVRDQHLPPARRAPMTPDELQAAQERWRAAVAGSRKLNKKSGELYTC